MSKKFYTVEKEFKGKKYVFQFNGVNAALQAVDTTYIEGSSNTSLEKMSEYLFNNVVVEPKGLTVDDFDNFDDFQEVFAFAKEVMQGYHAPEKTEKK